MPYWTDEYSTLPEEHLRNGRWAEAAAGFGFLLERDPFNADLYHQRGVAYFRQQQWEDALRDFTQALTLNTEHAAEAYYFRGICFFERDLLEAAQHDLEAALAQAQQDVAIWNALACLFTALGRLDEARQLLERTIRQEPDLADAHYNLARVLHQQGEVERAREHATRAADLDPDDPLIVDFAFLLRDSDT
jgi:tetratricopeptide (TPR) repeat protein